MQIVFTADVNTGSFRYEAQQSYDLDKPIADRFIAQGVARLGASGEGDAGPIQALASGDGNWVTLFPSGDTSGATDYANVSQYLTAAQGKNIRLAAGNWYFNDTLVRMPRRNAANTDWSYTGLLGRDTDAILPSFVGSGSNSCFVRFTNNTKPGIYVWRPPSGISGGPTLNVRQRANAADTSQDPWTAGSGQTGGFTLIGSASYLSMAGSLYDLDNEAAWPNHIGLAIWGATNYHELFDLQVKNWGTGIVTHDATALIADKVVVKGCDIGWGWGIQQDGGNFHNCWAESCRVGISLVWDGWQTGTGRSATFVGIGRESNGTYLTYSSSDNDCNTLTNCYFVGCTLAGVSGHGSTENTQALDCYSLLFNGCYWEANGSIMYMFRQTRPGMVAFKNCNFRGLAQTDVVGSYVQGGAKSGGASEILRKYIVSRIGVSQSTADLNYAGIWGYGGSASSAGIFDFENCRFDPSPYPIIKTDGDVQVNWRHNYYPVNGQTQFPTIFADLTNAQKGYRVNSATFGWNNANSQDWGDYSIQAGFVRAENGLPTAITTAVTLPTPSATYRGQTRMLNATGGVADTLYQCMKSAADTYTWKLVATG